MKNSIFILLLLLSFVINGQKIIPYHGPFPYPAPNKNMMFYLQRSIDRNTVIYELNHDMDGDLNVKKPIRIHWIDFEEGGKITPLTFTQNKFAYGLETELIDETKKIFTLRLVSYKKIILYLKPNIKTNTYQTHVVIKGKEVLLKRLFVNITGGTYFKPQVSHIELEGEDLQTGKAVKEKIIP
jgi:hypothetical protein